MDRETLSLAEDVLAGLQKACRDDDMEVAEDLLKVLEILAARDEAEEDVS